MGAPFKQHHIAAGAGRAGPLPHRHRRRGVCARAWSPAASWPACTMFFGGYPITPATPILHHLSRLKEFGITTFQAEDEIAAICAAIGASYAGQLGVTSSSGPGIALKTEAIGLAIMTELPLVIVNSQRGGPSTGLPTKTEQSDLYQAVYGRNADAPLPVIAARSPADAFDCAIEAVPHRHPVHDAGHAADRRLYRQCRRAVEGAGHERLRSRSRSASSTRRRRKGEGVMPYARDDELARPWIKPGTPGLEHRIGGIEKQPGTGNIDYSPASHQEMTDTRAAKVLGVANSIPDQDVCLGREGAELAVVGWGSTFGPIHQAVRRAHRQRAGRRPHPHPPHLADAEEYGCPTQGLRAYPRARDEHGPVQDRAARPVPGRRPAADQGSAASPFRIAEIEAAIDAALGANTRGVA